MKKIHQIANISFGKNLDASTVGDIAFIQSGSINETGEYDSRNIQYLNVEYVSKDDYLLPGDILFTAKGSIKSPYIIKEADLPAVASSVFFVIRPDLEQVYPEFLSWILTSPKLIHQINNIAEGSTITSISIREFRSITIEVPPLSIQKKITELNVLHKRYAELTLELQKKLEIMNMAAANKVININYE